MAGPMPGGRTGQPGADRLELHVDQAGFVVYGRIRWFRDIQGAGPLRGLDSGGTGGEQRRRFGTDVEQRIESAFALRYPIDGKLHVSRIRAVQRVEGNCDCAGAVGNGRVQ